MLVVDHPLYLERYGGEFTKLWNEFAKNTVRMNSNAAKKEAYQKANPHEVRPVKQGAHT